MLTQIKEKTQKEKPVGYDYQNVIIGAGAAGLTIAVGLAKAKKNVLLIERGSWGGDCTNFGCVPSKSLIASSHTAHALKKAREYGITCKTEAFDSSAALERSRRIVKRIRNHEEPAALRNMGVKTITGTASFIDRHTLNIERKNGKRKKISAKNIVIATGSRPLIPPIKGIDTLPFLTNENIFNLDRSPEHLAIIGGGPIGSELAQCFRRLGSKITLITRGPYLLSKEEKKAGEKIAEIFAQEGIKNIFNAKPDKVERTKENIIIHYVSEGKKHKITASHLLIAAGRKANVEELNPEAAGISTDKRGIIVDKYGRTTQKNIMAAGDCAGRALFTHVAENEGRGILLNLLLPWPLRIKLDFRQAIPHCTYTDPEIASLGLREEEAVKRYGETKIACYTLPFDQLDRAITSGREEGFIKVVSKKWSGKILGATIVAPRAGEMIAEIALAMRENIPLRRLSSLIHPYPTYNLAIRKAADLWLKDTILPALAALFRIKR